MNADPTCNIEAVAPCAAALQRCEAASNTPSRETAPRDARVVVEYNPAIAGLLNNRLAVIGLVAVAGPLGLPALWFSRRFSRLTKIITTVVFVLVTAVLPLALAYYWLEISLRPLVDAFGEVHK